MISIFEKIKKGENALIMCVGDSITWGLNHCSPEETYVANLAKFFAAEFPHITVLRYDGINNDGALPIYYYDGPHTVQSSKPQTLTIVRSGVGGNTVKRIINRESDFTGEFITKENPDLFMFMFGINDSLIFDSAKYVVPEVFYEHIKELHTIVTDKNPTSQIVYMTPTYNDLGTDKNSTVTPYAEKIRQHAKETHSHLIDTHALWMEHLEIGAYNHGQKDWLSESKEDTCHFSPLGSFNTAKFIFEKLKEL